MMLFFKVFFTEFIAEMGDKTQLMLIALTSKYKLRDIILGTAAAILVLNGLAVLAEAINDLQEELDLLGGEDGGGFIQNQNLRLRQKCPAKHELAFHTAGEGLHFLVPGF